MRNLLRILCSFLILVFLASLVMAVQLFIMNLQINEAYLQLEQHLQQLRKQETHVAHP